MCGIVGAFDLQGRELPVSEDIADRVLGLIAHRGPDDQGKWWSQSRSVFLGHRRLSIIDLSPAGHQPMTNEDGTVWIVYNGEVYNFAQIHDELVAKGHQFRSRTDTEVLIHGYEEYGVGIIDRLRGMFAFALYDAKRDQLLLARDRVGIKPLYYTVAAGRFYIASEIAPLIGLPGVEKNLNPAALNEYLAFGKVYAPNTMFDGVYKFPAAHYATVRRGEGMKLQRFWTPYQQRLEFPSGSGEEYHTGRLLDLLRESVQLRMVSDVPVGVFLSGGVDSTANVALMSEVAAGPVHTFTAGFQGQESYDERVYARRAAEYFKTEHDEIEITQRDLTDALPLVSSYLDEPIADPTVIPIFFLSKLARDRGAVVILNGDGGDELFCGYRKYMRYLKVAPYWKMLNALPRGMRRSLSRIGNSVGVNGITADLLDRSSRDVELYIGGTGALKGSDAFRELVDRPGSSNGGLYHAVVDGRKDFMAQRRSGDYAEWLSYWGVRSEIEHIFLYRADRMGMANSIEIRVPLLDHRLVEYAMQMPQELKYKGGEGKYILKKALEGTVPDEFLYRKKQGFCVPLREWAGGMMNEKIVRMLPAIRGDWGGLSNELIGSITARLNTDENTNNGGALSWNLYSLATWYERWFR